MDENVVCAVPTVRRQRRGGDYTRRYASLNPVLVSKEIARPFPTDGRPYPGFAKGKRPPGIMTSPMEFPKSGSYYPAGKAWVPYATTLNRY